jgi:hypothetical protein
MPQPELARGSHYVPQSYFRRWSLDGNKAWAYRLLVPHANVPVWDYHSIRSLAVRRDLYTSVTGGGESDRIETWFNHEIETPALAVLDQLCAGNPLSAQERRRLARYIASLSARSPLYYEEHTRMMGDHLESVLNATVEESLRKLSEARRAGTPIAIPTDDGIGYRPVAVKVHVDPTGHADPQIEVSAVVGREGWLESIQHIVNDLSVLLERHAWQVLSPHPGWSFYTTDHPVMRLNFTSRDKYDFKGGFGSPGTEIMLPLCKSHLLYTQIGHAPRDETVLGIEQTVLIKRCIAQNAFRWVVAESPSRNAAWFMPRVVNLAQYTGEENSWARYHDEQTSAVRTLETIND